jgi:hypothetical protein
MSARLFGQIMGGITVALTALLLITTVALTVCQDAI